jgi:hypothetical protein
MPIQVRGVSVHAMSGAELSRVRTEFRLRLLEPINKSPLESRGPTLLCNHVPYWDSMNAGMSSCQAYNRANLDANSGTRCDRWPRLAIHACGRSATRGIYVADSMRWLACPSARFPETSPQAP